MWPCGNDMARPVEGPEIDYGQNLFIFAFYLFFFSVCFRLVFFLVIAVLSCFFIWLKFFRFTNFLFYCLILPFPQSPSKVLRFTYFWFSYLWGIELCSWPRSLAVNRLRDEIINSLRSESLFSGINPNKY